MVGQTWKPARSIEIRLVSLQAADLTFVSLLNRPERERLNRIVAEADRARFLLGAALLRQGVGEHLGIDPAKVEVDRTCSTCGGWHGRPTVPDSDLQLSVAHSGTLVAVGIAAGYRIGVDIEKIGTRPVEQLRRWTLAEARFKGGGDDLPVYEVSPPRAGYILTIATDAPTPVVSATTDIRRLNPWLGRSLV